MKKNFKNKLFQAASVFFSMLFIFVSCGHYVEEKVVQSDRGVPVTKIELSATGLVLSGSRSVTTATLVAKCIPSFADDDELTWTSSDESVVSVQDTNGKSCVLTLEGNGEAVVTVQNFQGNAKAFCNVKAKLSVVKPFKVTGVSCETFSEAAKITWTTPEKNADGLKETQIRIYKSKADADEDKDIVALRTVETTVAGREYSATVTSLESGTDYYALLSAVNFNGYASDAQSLSFATKPAGYVEPVEATDLSVSYDSSYKYSGYAKLSWTDPDGEFESLRVSAVSAAGGSVSATVEKGVQEHVFKGLDCGVKYTFSVTALDSADAEKGSVSVEGYASIVSIRFFNNGTSHFIVVQGDPSTVATSTARYLWIKREALDGSATFSYDKENPSTGTVPTFSLEAMDPETHVGTGLYLCLTGLDLSNSAATLAHVSLEEKTALPDSSYTTFIKAKAASSMDSDYSSLRIATDDADYQIGDKDDCLQYRNSTNPPGVAMWCWKFVEEDLTPSD